LSLKQYSPTFSIAQACGDLGVPSKVTSIDGNAMDVIIREPIKTSLDFEKKPVNAKNSSFLNRLENNTIHEASIAIT
jgi:hypothetical protein